MKKEETPAFKRALELVNSLGQFSENSIADKAYKSLRLKGLSREEAIEAINKELNLNQ